LDFDLSEEHTMIKRAAREFAEKEIMPYGREYDQKRQYPMKIFKKAAKLGFIAPSIPEEYGGQSADFLSEIIIAEEFTRADSSIGIAVISATLGCPMIKDYGTEEQKEKYLAKVPKGENISGIAITEPEAGSDVASMKTKAKLVDDQWVINGTKTFITNASIGDWLIVLARTNSNVSPHKGISAFIVETNVEGYSATPLEKMGLNCCDTCEVYFENVRVPKENLVGEENYGFYQLMKFFNESRILTGAFHLGIAQGAFERALNYAKERKAFGKPLIKHQAIQFKLADMVKEIEAARLLVYKAAWKVNNKRLDAALSSICKLYATEAAVRVTYEAVQIYGGFGYIKESDVERYYRDARVGTIYEGTSEIQKIIIAKQLQYRTFNWI